MIVELWSSLSNRKKLVILVMGFLYTVERGIDAVSDAAGKTAALLALLMVAVVFYDVIMRYGFGGGSIAMQELEWHLYATVFLLGIAYGMKEDAHVRVDIFYSRLAPRHKALINVLGALLFVLPFAGLIVYHSYEFVEYSFELGERSNDPGGLPHTFVIKAAIPVAFILVFLAALGMIARNLRILLGPTVPPGDA